MIFEGYSDRSVAAAGTDDCTVKLPFKSGMHNYLTGFQVFCESPSSWAGFGGTVNATGPYIFGVEVWLKRPHGAILLDKGWACYDKKYRRCIVGFSGRIAYDEQDVIYLAIKNAGAITAIWGCSGTYDASVQPYNELGVVDRLHDDVTFIYQARRVNAQGAAGPAALVTRISMNPGQVGRLIQYYVKGSASATDVIYSTLLDEDTAQMGNLAYVAAAANTTAMLPSIGTAANATNNYTNSMNLIISPGEFLLAGATVTLSTETLTVGVVLELLNDPTLPIWDTTGSGGTPALGANSISATNELQPIIRPRMIG